MAFFEALRFAAFIALGLGIGALGANLGVVVHEENLNPSAAAERPVNNATVSETRKHARH